MINRIRDVRLQKGMTLAQVAAACEPATTAQTIGRLETGMRNLSLVWMNRIAAALGVEPELLLRSESAGEPKVTAILARGGVRVPAAASDALLPAWLGGDQGLRVLAVEIAIGEYRPEDQVWLRELSIEQAAQALNRDVLAPLADGRLVFGRMVENQGKAIRLLPLGGVHGHVLIDNPEWLAAAEMLVRKL